MKYAFLGLLSICLLAFTINDPVTPLPIGSTMPMPEHKIKDVSGKEVDLKLAVAENGLLVVFSCNTCPYVVKSERRINQLIGVTKNNNVGMIILNSNEAYRNGDDSYPAMQEYAILKKLTCFYAVDEANMLADAFGATRTPECFLFDKNLKLVYHGAIDDNVNDESAVKRKHVEVAMKEMIKGEEVSMPETKSIGCGIKRKS
jgi:thioredoxin-related protein